MMVLDESSRIKNPQAKQTKAALKLGQKCVRRYIMTGTPMASNPLDFFSQFLFLSPAILGFASRVAYQARYAVMGGYQVEIGNFKKAVNVVGWKNLDELEEKIASYSRRVLKKDCLDLPEKLYEKRLVPLSHAT